MSVSRIIINQQNVSANEGEWVSTTNSWYLANRGVFVFEYNEQKVLIPQRTNGVSYSTSVPTTIDAVLSITAFQAYRPGALVSPEFLSYKHRVYRTPTPKNPSLFTDKQVILEMNAKYPLPQFIQIQNCFELKWRVCVLYAYATVILTIYQYT